MSVATDLMGFLLAQSSITDLVGSNISQASVDQVEDLPYILFRRSGRTCSKLLDGEEQDVVMTVFDFEARAATHDQAEEIADALDDLLNGYAGEWDLTNGTGTREIQGVFVEDQDDDYVLLPVGSDQRETIVTLRVQVFSTT